MNCPNCHQVTAPGSSFCGTCGFQLASSNPAPPQAVPAAPTAPVPPPAPVYQAPVQPLAPAPMAAPVAVEPHNNGKALAAMILGVLGLPGCLVPIVGVILGILALVFGTIALKSQKRKFAIAGIVLAVPVLALSIFFWVSNAQDILKQREAATKSITGPDATSSQKEDISTSCYKTTIPSGLTVTQSAGSCTFEAVNRKKGDQVVVKVMQADSISEANLEAGAKEDAKNVVGSIPGGSIANQAMTTFAGSPAYKVMLEATDGSAGVVYYVYHKTDQGKLVIILRTQASGRDYDLSSIEDSWTWR